MSSRLPLPSRKSISSTSTPKLSGSVLGKRSADSDSFAGTPRGTRDAPDNFYQIERDAIKLRKRESELEEVVRELKEENERFKSERRTLFDGEKKERLTGQEREKGWSTERLQMHQSLKDLRLKNSTLSNNLEQLKSDHSQLNNTHSSLTMNTSREISGLNSRLKELESERESMRGWERRANGLSIQLEEEKRKREEVRRGQEDKEEGGKVDEVVRKELRRQSQHLVTLEQTHRSLSTEVIELRQRRKEADAAERAMKDVERALREEIRTLQEQLERSRRDMDSLTTNFSAPSDTSEDMPTLQSRLASLSALHQQATSELSAKDAELRELQERHSQSSFNSRKVVGELSARAIDAERELRWAKEGRAAAERREELAKREVEALRADSGQGRSSPAGVVSSSSDQTARITQLESVLETYKSELEGIQRDSRDVEDRLTEGAGLVKRNLLDDAQARINQLDADIQSLESTITALTSANTTLDAEVNDLMRRVASGEYNPATERCMELKQNPAAKIHAVRNKELEELKRENEVLLERLEGRAGVGGEGEGLVPRESWERLKKEKEDLEQGHAKRLLRLKEIFGTKSKEFLEAVYSLLGWRIKFDESGADIRLTSMYAPKGKMGLTLKFASQEGHFGTMQMTGAMARGLEESRHFWIVERQSVPGFLAQVTTEMFEKTTIGRAAGYVGLD